jgi:uncharacterized protein (DUF952 family)
MIFHITARSQWQQAQQVGEYRADSLATEGFIHCSQATQLVWVANQFYRGIPDLVLLQIDPAQLTAPLQYDEIETGDQFPHLYGALNLEAVVQAIAFPPQHDGTFALPTAIRDSE